MTKVTPENAHDIIAKHMLADLYPFVVDLEKSQGNRIYDAKSKRHLLDCFSYIASNPLGHNHPKLHQPEFEKKLLRAARCKPANSDLLTVEFAEFVDVFSRIAMPESMPNLFFIEGGALTVENAMKTAFDWKVRLNKQKGVAGEEGTKVLHFTKAFHGRSGYTLSVTNTADPRKTKYFPKFDWPRVEGPVVRFPLEGANLHDVVEKEKQAVAQIEAAFAKHKDDIAAILIEPIQGEGGDNHFRAEFFRELRRLADEHEAMLIFDEIQSGIGLTGKMWAYEHYGVLPDILCSAKKLQLGAICVSDRVKQAENNVFEEASRINSTWGGGLVDMVRAAKILEVIDEESLVENARIVGEQLLQCLQQLCENFPALFSNPRGKGLMCAVDMATPEQVPIMLLEARKLDLLILRCGTKSLRFRPSLTFTLDEVAEVEQKLTEAARALS